MKLIIDDVTVDTTQFKDFALSSVEIREFKNTVCRPHECIHLGVFRCKAGVLAWQDVLLYVTDRSGYMLRVCPLLKI